MKSNQILIIYSFIVCLILTLVGIFSAKNASQLISSLIFMPLIFYFGTRILRFKRKAVVRKTIINNKTIHIHNNSTTLLNNANSAIPSNSSNNKQAPIEPEIVKGVTDNDKRLFLKLIGTTSFSILLMSLFTKKAQASFFGSVPGPGVVSIKDAAGNKINPAEKNPTDGYGITKIDDTGEPVYYGFVKKTGEWYIMSSAEDGSFLYAKGTDDFATSWGNRNTTLTYDYFDTVFG